MSNSHLSQFEWLTHYEILIGQSESGFRIFVSMDVPHCDWLVHSRLTTDCYFAHGRLRSSAKPLKAVHVQPIPPPPPEESHGKHPLMQVAMSEYYSFFF